MLKWLTSVRVGTISFALYEQAVRLYSRVWTWRCYVIRVWCSVRSQSHPHSLANILKWRWLACTHVAASMQRSLALDEQQVCLCSSVIDVEDGIRVQSLSHANFFLEITTIAMVGARFILVASMERFRWLWTNRPYVCIAVCLTLSCYWGSAYSGVILSHSFAGDIYYNGDDWRALMSVESMQRSRRSWMNRWYVCSSLTCLSRCNSRLIQCDS